MDDGVLAAEEAFPEGVIVKGASGRFWIVTATVVLILMTVLRPREGVA